KSPHQFDLPFGERLDPLTPYRKGSDQFALAQERHTGDCPQAAKPDRFGPVIFWIGGDIVDVDNTALLSDATDNGAAAWPGRHVARILSSRVRDEFLPCGRQAEEGNAAIAVALASKHQ